MYLLETYISNKNGIILQQKTVRVNEAITLIFELSSKLISIVINVRNRNSINLYYNLLKKGGDSSKSFNWNRFQFKYKYVESLLFIKKSKYNPYKLGF